MQLPLKWYPTLTKGQLKVLEVFERDVFREHTFTEIKETSREKSSNLIQTALKELAEQKILQRSKRGNLVFYASNPENFLVEYCLGLIQQAKLQRYSKEARKAMQSIVSELVKRNPFCSILLFGSYASMQQTKQSDMDIAIITENKEQHKDYETGLKSLSLKLFVKIDYHLITAKEFVEMLLVDYENVGKQVYENNIPLYNNFVYYSLLKEARKNGFAR